MKAKRSKTPAKSASKKVVIKDLKAKDTGSVKGGGTTVSGEFDISKRH